MADDLARTEAIAIELSQRVATMRADLAGLDRTIKVFDARLDPEKIVAIRAHRRPGQRGSLRSAMLQILEDGARPNGWEPTS